MRKLRVILALQILAVVMFVGGGFYILPTVFKEDVPWYIKLFAGMAIFMLVVIMIDNGLGLRNAFRRARREEAQEREQDQQNKTL